MLRRVAAISFASIIFASSLFIAKYLFYTTQIIPDKNKNLLAKGPKMQDIFNFLSLGARINEAGDEEISRHMIEHIQRTDTTSAQSSSDTIEDKAANVVIFISGNWYDSNKVSEVVRLGRIFPDAHILVTGGLGRLSDKTSIELGSEAAHMEVLLENAGITAERITTYTSGRVTTDNLKNLIEFIQKRTAAEVSKQSDVAGKTRPSKAAIIVVEESYLCRRLLASLMQLMGNDRKVVELVHSLMLVSTSTDWEGLVSAHGGSESVASWLVLGELIRLRDYSDPSQQPFLFHRAAALGSIDGSAREEEFSLLLEPAFTQMKSVSMEESELLSSIETLNSKFGLSHDDVKRSFSSDNRSEWETWAPVFNKK